MLESISPIFSGALLLASILAGVGLLLYLGTVELMARMLLRPPRMTDGKAVWVLKRLTPEDLNLSYTPLTFDIRDQRNGSPLHIAAWWIPHPDAHGRCVVLIHGYADAKVGAIAWAPTLHALGLNLLVLDLRAHGESGGRFSTAGYFERHDLSQVIDQFRAREPEQTRHLILMGVSLGAAVAAATAAQRTDIAAVILESPFSDYAHAALAHGNALGTPGRPFGRAAVQRAQRISGADFSAVRPIDFIPTIPAPLMLIHSGADLFVSAADFTALQTAMSARSAQNGASVIWSVPSVPHVQALAADPDEYRRRLDDFLTHALPSRE